MTVRHLACSQASAFFPTSTESNFCCSQTDVLLKAFLATAQHMHSDSTLAYREPCKRLSAPFQVLGLNLQQRVDAIAGAAARQVSVKAALQWEVDKQITVDITQGGLWNAVTFWFEVEPPCITAT